MVLSLVSPWGIYCLLKNKTMCLQGKNGRACGYITRLTLSMPHCCNRDNHVLAHVYTDSHKGPYMYSVTICKEGNYMTLYKYMTNTCKRVDLHTLYLSPFRSSSWLVAEDSEEIVTYMHMFVLYLLHDCHVFLVPQKVIQ